MLSVIIKFLPSKSVFLISTSLFNYLVVRVVDFAEFVGRIKRDLSLIETV